MATNSGKVLNVDTGTITVYDTADLDLFQKILNDIIDEHEDTGVLSVSDQEYLRKKLAVAIFKSAEAGERDYSRLKRRAIAAMSAPPSSYPASG
jgi:hypothetical protein